MKYAALSLVFLLLSGISSFTQTTYSAGVNRCGSPSQPNQCTVLATGLGTIKFGWYLESGYPARNYVSFSGKTYDGLTWAKTLVAPNRYRLTATFPGGSITQTLDLHCRAGRGGGCWYQIEGGQLHLQPERQRSREVCH
jgi:hypothetical protein